MLLLKYMIWMVYMLFNWWWKLYLGSSENHISRNSQIMFSQIWEHALWCSKFLVWITLPQICTWYRIKFNIFLYIFIWVLPVGILETSWWLGWSGSLCVCVCSIFQYAVRYRIWYSASHWIPLQTVRFPEGTWRPPYSKIQILRHISDNPK